MSEEKRILVFMARDRKQMHKSDYNERYKHFLPKMQKTQNNIGHF